MCYQGELMSSKAKQSHGAIDANRGEAKCDQGESRSNEGKVQSRRIEVNKAKQIVIAANGAQASLHPS